MFIRPPWTARQIESCLVPFTEWLTLRGAEVLCPTNEWEVLRFRDGVTVSIIYKNKRDEPTFMGSSYAAWNAYKNAKAWHASTKKAKRKKKKARHYALETIRERDGNNCFYCNQFVEEKDESVEHVIDIKYGGPAHIANEVLAHIKCNEAAAGMPLLEKIKVYCAARQ